jgi:2-polyprenyl-3-methyl-5-hydroxy-6-metoxy-1,4-benzoquinol methylase
MVSHIICPLCSSSRIEFYLKCRDHLLSGEEFELYKCESCSFIFTQEYPDEIQIGNYYDSEEYISHDDNATGVVSRVYYVVRKIMLRKKKKIIKETTGLNAGSLLDIGCGTGHFPGFMRNEGWKVKGIESNLKAREYSKQKYGIEIVDPEDIVKLPRGSFDCITMWHVLEHFHDPSVYANEILRLLRPGGVCIVALPNSNSYDALHFGKYWAAWDVPRHLWHFTPDTFTVFAEKFFRKIKEIRTLPFDVFYISILSEKYKGRHFYLLRGVLKGTLFAFYSLFNRRKSSSLIYIIMQ